MDHYADDLAALTTHLDLNNAIHVGHSTGGGEVTRYLARHGENRVSMAALISAVPPLMVKTAANPGRAAQGSLRWIPGSACRQSFAVLSRRSVRPVLWLQPAGSEILRGGYSKLVAPGDDGRCKGALRRHRRLFTKITEDLKKISVPVLVLHSEDDQIVPYVAAGPLSAKLLKNATLKTYKDFPHGMPTTHADTINADLLAFIQG